MCTTTLHVLICTAEISPSEIAPKPLPPDLLVTQPSDTALPQQEEKATNLLTDKPSPADPLHYQLSTTAAGNPDGRPLPTEPEDHSISSDWDSDDEASLPLSSPNSPIPLTKLEPGSTSAITGPLQESSQPASNPEGRSGEQLQTETVTKLQEDKTQPEEEEVEEEEEEVEVSDFDSDFSLDGDLPDFGGYEPSTSSDVGRSELLRRRSSTSLHDKGSAAFVAAPKERPATLASPESSAVAVTPLSSTAFTPDAGSNNPERSPFGALNERGDGEAGMELSKGVEKVLSFSEQREETGVHQEESLQEGKEKRDEFDDSDWDSKEEEELSESVQGTSRQVDFLPESKVTPPTRPKADYFSYYNSDSEGEEEIEKAVMPPSVPPPPTGAGAEERKKKLDKDHMPSSLVHAGGVEAVMEQKSPTPTVSIPSPLAPVSSVAGKFPSVGTHDTSRNEQKGLATLEQSASSEESESEWEQDQRLKRNRPPLQVTPNRPTSPPLQVTPNRPTSPPVSAEHNEHRLQGSPEEVAARTSSETPEGERGRKRRGPRRGTTTVTTDDLAAARIKMEDEASERFHSKQNELQTLLKSRGKWTDNTWVSPRHKAKGDSEQSQSPLSLVQLPSLLAPRNRTDVPELEMKDSGFTSLEQETQPSGEGGVVPRGKSKVQLMKEVWESKLPFRQTGADETPGDRLGVCETQEQDSASPPVSSWLEPQNTFQEDGPKQDTTADMLPAVKVQAPTELAALNSGGHSPGDQKEESEEEILELLSDGDSEGEGGEGREMEREGKRERDEERKKEREGRVEAGGLLPLETKPLERVPDDRTTENNTLATKLPEPSQVTPKVQEQPKVTSSLPNPGDSRHRSTPVTKEGTTPPNPGDSRHRSTPVTKEGTTPPNPGDSRHRSTPVTKEGTTTPPNPGDSRHRSTPVTKEGTTPPRRPRPVTKPLSSQTSGDDDITSTESEVRFWLIWY